MITLEQVHPVPDRARDAERTGDRPSSLALVGCGQATPRLVAAFEVEGVPARGFDGVTDALQWVTEDPPALVVLGTDAPGTDAARLLALLARRPFPVLFLAPDSNPSTAKEALSLGGDDVLPPPHSHAAIHFRATVMLERSRARRSEPDSPCFGRIRVDLEGRRLLYGDEPVNLSGREFELLHRLLEAGGHVVTRRKLLTDIWGAQQRSEGVLDATVHRLRRKLELNHSDPRHLTTVRGVGYRLETTTSI